MTTIIELKQVKKCFKEQTSVDLHHLTIREGEIYGFLGPNGAGKTTTMKMILSLIAPTSGEITVRGKSIADSSDYLQEIGSMIEEPSYYPNLTAYENLLVFQRLLGFDKDNIWETLKLVGLADPKNKKKLVKDYSLGMKQRLALAFALVKKPKILLLDEPTNGLDPAGIHEIRQLIIELAKRHGLTILISSHILTEIEQMADRVGIINRGQLVYEGDLETIKANQWIAFRGQFDKAKLLNFLQTHFVVDDFAIGNQMFTLKHTGDDVVAFVARELIAMGGSLVRIEHKKESLEDIFLHLTKEV